MQNHGPPRLTARFSEALSYATELHQHQRRKGGDIPYIGHLLSVASLVIEADGSETQVIAALLHDAAEDQGGAETLADIESRFGTSVAAIVSECSAMLEMDSDEYKRGMQPISSTHARTRSKKERDCNSFCTLLLVCIRSHLKSKL